MGVDYTTSIAIGRLIPVQQGSIKGQHYERFEELENKYSHLCISFMKQEYKGDILATGLFVGVILHETDPREPFPLMINDLITMLQEIYNLDMINTACDELKDQLELEGEFSSFGVHSLVNVY